MTDFTIELSNAPSEGRRRALFSIRSLLYFFAWLCLWQGWNATYSIFQLNFVYGWFPPNALLLHEYFLIFTCILLVLEKVLSGNYTLARSYFTGPMLLISFALILSWAQGMYIVQQFGIVYEAHESILIPISFFIFINVFRDPKERKILLILFFLASIMKAADSIWVYYFSTNPQKGWGTLLFWRDGFLICMGIVGTLLFAHYRGRTYRWLRNLMFISGPVLMFGLIISFRRTFIIGLFFSVGLMFFSVGKGRVKRQFWLFLLSIIGLVVFVLISDPLGIIGRLFGALIMPTEEGSAYIRLMEYPNILMNIYHHPIFGIPIGTPWFQYYRMPIFANYTQFGCHNSYLYWPLRTGIIGTVAFFWFLGRTWKAILINLRTEKTEEDFLMNQLLLHSMIIYNFSCFFGLMYADAMNIMTGYLLVMVQLQMTHQSGLISYRKVRIWKTFKSKKLIFRKPVMPINLSTSRSARSS